MYVLISAVLLLLGIYGVVWWPTDYVLLWEQR